MVALKVRGTRSRLFPHFSSAPPTHIEGSGAGGVQAITDGAGVPGARITAVSAHRLDGYGQYATLRQPAYPEQQVPIRFEIRPPVLLLLREFVP
jgi:hypothetical protein